MKKIYALLLAIFVLIVTGYAQPANDDCGNATAISISSNGTTCVTGTTTGATPTTWTTPVCGQTSWTNDVWYSFVSTGTENTVIVSPTGNPAAQKLGVSIYSGNCTNPVGAPGSCAVSTTNGGSDTAFYPAAAGTVFYVEVSSFGNAGGFQLCITSGNAPPTPASTCATAAKLCTEAPFAVAQIPHGGSGFTPDCFVPNTPAAGQWYQFTVGVGGLLGWQCTPTGTEIELDWALYDITTGCPTNNNQANEVACNFNFSNYASNPIGMRPHSATNCPVSGTGNARKEFCPSAAILAGHTYAIFINNYSFPATTGWNFNFDSSTFLMAPVDTFTLSPDTFCGNTGTVTINNTSVAEIAQVWNFGDGSSSTTTNPGTHTYTAPGTYFISLKDSSITGCTATKSKSVLVSAYPTVTVKNDTICPGGTGTLTAVPSLPGGTYHWSTGATSSSISASPGGNTSYTVTYTSAVGCTASATGTIITAAPTATVTPANVAICPSGSTNLTATTGISYSWSTGSALHTITVSPAVPTTYLVTVTFSGGCTATASANVTIETPTASVTPPMATVCPSASATFTASAGTAYIWSTGATTASITVTPAGTTSYSVTVTDASGCTASATCSVDVSNNPTTNVSPVNPTICPGASSTLTAGNGTAYVWSTGATTQAITVTPTAATTYSVTVTSAGTCTATASTTVSIGTNPAPVAANTGPYCPGASVTLNVTTSGTTYSWSGPNAYSSPSQNPVVGSASSNLAGIYNVTATDNNGCTGTATTTVVVNNTPAASATNTGPYCVSANIQLIAGGGDTYSWNGPDAYTSNIQNPVINNATTAMAGTYTVTVTDNNGCTASAPTTVTVNTPPTANAGPPDTITCANTQVTLNAVTGAGFGYSWSGPGIVSGANTATPVVDAAGTYNLTVTDVNSCTATANTTVIALPDNVTLSLTGTPVSCAGGDGTIAATANGGATPYQYTLNGGASQSSGAFNALNIGFYTVQAQDAQGCTATDTITITTTNPQRITVTVINPVCASDSGTITAAGTGGVPPFQYAINGGAWQSSGVFSGLTGGTYTIATEDVHTCSATATATVNAAPAPVVVAPVATPDSCPGYLDGAITANASGGTSPYNYAWSNNATDAAIATNLGAGVYTVTATDANQCTGSGTAAVGQLNGIVYTATSHNIFCVPLQNGSAEIDVDANSLPVTYLWSNGARSAGIYQLGMGAYSVTVTNAAGCHVDTSFVVGNDSAFSVSVSPVETTIQLGNATPISVVPHGDSISFMYWNPSEYLACDTCANTQASPIQTILYRAFVTSDSGCTAYDSILINVIPYYNIYVPNAFTPNGDGNNDMFQVFGEKNDWKQFKIEIFDRWGEKVYESSDMNFAWDGLYKGKPLSTGVYIYELHLTYLDNHSAELYKGSITLIR